MKNALGEKIWVQAASSPSHLGVPGDKILFTEHHQAHAAAAFLTAPTRTRGDPDRRRRRRVGDAHRRPRRAARRRQRVASTLVREMRFPHSLGMLYSTFTAYLGFPVNEGEYKVMGLAVLRTAAHSRRGAQADAAHAGRRLRARPRLLRVSHHARALASPIALHRPVRAAAGPVRAHRSRHAGGPRASPTCAASVQRVLEDVLVDLARSLAARDRAAGPLPGRRRAR